MVEAGTFKITLINRSFVISANVALSSLPSLVFMHVSRVTQLRNWQAAHRQIGQFRVALQGD